MDWADTAEQAAFRAQVREVLEHGLPDLYKRRAKGEADDEGGFDSWGADRARPGRRRVRRKRAEDLALGRAPGSRAFRARAHRPGRAQARRLHLLVHRRHPHAGPERAAVDQHGWTHEFNETFFEDVRVP